MRKLAQYRKQFETLLDLQAGGGMRFAGWPRRAAKGRARDGGSALTETRNFGADPGNLRMLSFVPDSLPSGAPLVVVLHGCTQTAEEYDHGAGWSELARRFGFALLYPEQRQANNAHLCFNWFLPGDTSRDRGEAASIRQMICRMIRDHGLDPKRVGITGLSAGGAMTAAMLSCYPETFAEGAIIAGLPYGAAANVQEALGAMFQGVTRTGEAWAERVRAAAPHAGPWPRVSIWHGSADATVKPVNAAESIRQWTAVHGLPAEPSIERKGDGFTHRVWRDGNGADLVEAYEVIGMAHGIPIGPAVENPEERCGAAGRYMFDVGLSSSYLIAKAWGLTGKVTAGVRSGAAPIDAEPFVKKALKRAGLMK